MAPTKKRPASSAKQSSREKYPVPERHEKARASPPIAREHFEAVIRRLITTPTPLSKKRATPLKDK
jgi:hypothetical protein